jgi:hypothetical protein
MKGALYPGYGPNSVLMATLSTKLTIPPANCSMKDSGKLAGPGKFEEPVIGASALAVWFRGCDSGGSKNESKDEGISKDEEVGEEEKIRDHMVVLMVREERELMEQRAWGRNFWDRLLSIS